jgi:hypothetical protein
MGITYCSDGTTENGELALVAGTWAFLPRWALALTEQRPSGGAIRLRDRMGSRGLRPAPLPHHRTCG